MTLATLTQNDYINRYIPKPTSVSDSRPNIAPSVNDRTNTFNKYLENTGSATRTSPLEREVNDKLLSIVSLANAEAHLFETGEMTQFSQNLANVIAEYGNLAIETLRKLIASKQISSVVAGEALRSIGELEDQTISTSQFLTLVHFLFDPSPRIRDGAIMGLSFLNSELAVAYLILALQQEPDEFLKSVINQVLTQLKYHK